MKRIIALFLSFALFLSGCTYTDKKQDVTDSVKEDISEWNDIEIQYDSLDNEQLLLHIEDLVYNETVKELDNENYFVENVSAVYISKEYLEEVAFNSQSNIYFGYTIAELNELFEGSKYVFTVGDDGQTMVKELEIIDDSISEEIIKNIAIGTGVILICVTVSVVSGGLGAPAISMIFAASAKTGTIMAFSSATIGGVSAGIARGIETGDMNEALEAVALVGSEGFKLGAISGVIEGGAAKAITLKGATLKGLKMNEAAKIQSESGLPLDFIKNFHSIDEYNIYKNSGLQINRVNGKYAYTQKIDWDFIGNIEDGKTNAQRVNEGLSPLDITGKPYEVHHVGQEADSPFAILTHSQHHDNYGVLHANTGTSESKIDRNIFEKEKDDFWIAFYEMTRAA